jgi:3-hydroxyisobutyrate dehydrogenase
MFRCLLNLSPQGNLGFVGLGSMGSNMVKNLLATKGSAQIYVYDKNPQAMKALESLGGIACANLKEMAENVDTVISMVTSTEHVQQVYLGPEGLLQHLKKESLCIDCSTIDPLASKEVIGVARDNGIQMIDAPVGGGVPAAKAGQLTFMVGVASEGLSPVQSILKRMGQTIVPCGGPSMGQAAKLCNNLVLGASMVAVGEAFRLGHKLGVDLGQLNAIINSSSGRCWSSEVNNPVPGLKADTPASRAYGPPCFMVDLIHKDLGLALDTGKKVGLPMAATEFSKSVYQKLKSEGHGTKDFSCTYEFTP